MTAFFVTLGCAAIGFVDDWTKVSRRRSLGLSGRWKLLWLGAITVVVADRRRARARHALTTDVYLPLLDVDLPLSWGWYVLLFFIIAGASNGVNLTDGLDGLAAGTTTIALLTYTAMSLVAALASIRAVGRRRPGRPRPRDPRREPRRGLDRLPLVQRLPRRRSSWATPARWGSAARSPRSRS